MTGKLPILNDCTRTARIIGYATTAEEAAKVWEKVVGTETIMGDDETLTVPQFASRLGCDLDLTDPEDMDEVRKNGAWEPLV